MKLSIPMCLSFALSGMPFCGADIPGFAGSPTQDLFRRWYNLGIFYPFYRGHRHLDYPNREPWLQTAPVYQSIKSAVYMRYDFIQYIYTQFYQATLTGAPPMRPLWYEFPQDKTTFDIESQFMFGSQLLVCPELEEKSESAIEDEQLVYLPPTANWYLYSSKLLYAANGFVKLRVLREMNIPVFVKAGTILFKKTERR